MSKITGRPRGERPTAFGQFLDRKNISDTQAAEELGVSRAHVSSIASGATAPGFKLICRIRDWAAAKGGRLPASVWETKRAAS